MSTMIEARGAVRSLFRWIAGGSPTPDGMREAAVCDDESGHYTMLEFGRSSTGEPSYDCYLHVEFTEDKVHVHVNRTDIDIVRELLDAGVPRPNIVTGADPVVVLGHGLWQRRFGSDPGVVGRSLILERRSFRVVGVMPKGFDMPEPGVEMWMTSGRRSAAR